MNTSIDPYQLAPEMRCGACPAATHHRCIGLDARLYCRRAQEAAAGADNGYPETIRRRSGEARVKLEIATGPASEAPPYPDRDRFRAPLRREPAIPWARRPWEGCARRKPWEYRVVAALAHLDQPDLLAAVVETLRGQTVRPFIHVIDTGSLAPVRRRLEALELECDDMQIDYLSPRGWAQTSAPVAVAMDLAFATCPPNVEYLYSTHVDVFLKRPDFLEYLAARCDAQTPVVGYQMSPRRGWRDDLWARVPSHTASLYHMPTMRAIGATWNMVHAAERLDLETERYFDAAFPDTETNLGLTLIREDIGMRWLEADGTDPGRPRPGERRSWLCLGPEPNEPYDTPWLRHERSYTAHAVYAPDVAQERRARCERSIAESRERVRSWSIPAAIPVPAAPAPATLPDWPAAWRAARADPRIALADCGSGVWVGNRHACDALGSEFDHVIHFRYDDKPTDLGCCSVAIADRGNLIVRYTDAEPLATARPVLAEIVPHLASGRTLIHCAAGLCRGPTFAVIALVVRGFSVEATAARVRAAVATYHDAGPRLEPAILAEIAAAFAPKPVDTDDARAATECPHRQVQPGARPCTPAVCRPTGRRPGELVRLADCVACINDER